MKALEARIGLSHASPLHPEQDPHMELYFNKVLVDGLEDPPCNRLRLLIQDLAPEPQGLISQDFILNLSPVRKDLQGILGCSGPTLLGNPTRDLQFRAQHTVDQRASPQL